MINQYLDMLEDSLTQKASILKHLTELSERQRDIIAEEKIDWDNFDSLVDEKSELIDKLNGLDDGFESVYDRIKDELSANKSQYKDKIQSIQGLITGVTELSTSLMALEERNRSQVAEGFKAAKLKINQNKTNSKVASNYYKAMSRVNFIDPQLMDKKK